MTAEVSSEPPDRDAAQAVGVGYEGCHTYGARWTLETLPTPRDTEKNHECG